MADKRPGVRGPRGPKPNQPSSSASSRPASPREEPSALHRFSLPLISWLNRQPKWVVVVALAVLLVLGMVQTGSLAWLGALILGLLTLFFAWLLALMWPVTPAGGRMLRLIVVVALAGLTVLKATGSL